MGSSIFAQRALVFLWAGLGLGACQTAIEQTVANAETTGAAPESSQNVTLAAASPAQTAPARGGKPGACVGPQISITVPPVPNKAASIAGGMVENAGRNVIRNVGTNVVSNQVASRIPGIGGMIGVAATQTAAKDVVQTAEDVRGVWTATDGSPRCGCQLEFSKAGLFVSDYLVAGKGCAFPNLAAAARWKVIDTGVASQDLVLLAADNTTELARLDRKGVDYFQGIAGGTTLTVWR